MSNAKGGELGRAKFTLDTVTQGRLLKEAACEPRSEGSQEQAMKKNIPGKGNRSTVGRNIFNLSEEHQGRRHIEVQQPLGTWGYLHFAKLIKTRSKTSLSSSVI